VWISSCKMCLHIHLPREVVLCIEVVDSIKNGLRKAVDAVASSRPRCPRTRVYPCLLCTKRDNIRRRKRKLEHRFKKTGSAKDFQSFKTHLSLYVRELRKSKSSFLCKTLSSNSNDSKTAFKTVNFLLNRGKNSPLQADPTHANFLVVLCRKNR